MAEAKAGEIFIEGLGTIKIQGDVPTEEESRSIAEAVNQNPDSEGDPFVTSETPEPKSEPGPSEGPLGIMPTEARGNVRKNIESQPGLIQLLSEMGPAVGGAFAGATMGAPAGPLGMLAGGVAGGLLGETVAQETGFAPKSDLNMALSGAGPAVGPAVGKGFQLLRRGVGTGIAKGFPAARVAHGRNIAARAVGEFESLGTTILGKQKGLMARSADDLFKAMRRVKIRIKPDQITSTRQAIDDAIKELEPVSSIPEVKQTIRTLTQIDNIMLNNPNGALLDEFIRARSFIGSTINLLGQKTKGRIKSGKAKQIFAAMSDDLDRFAASPFRRGSQARLALSGVQRAKLEFSVRDLEAAVARFTKDAADIPGGVTIDFKGLQSWLRNVTNPKSAQYDKNFTTALADELPDLTKRVSELAKSVSTGSPGGPGSIVLRGQAAKMGRALMGGALGFLGTGGSAAGAAIGGLAFAQLPEMLVSVLTTKAGAAFLQSAAKAGRGHISQRAWQTAFQIAMRTAGDQDEKSSTQRSRETVRGIKGTPSETGRAQPLNPREALRR